MIAQNDAHHFGGANKMLAPPEGLHYHLLHIRPLVVSPLDHPERELSPWGFAVSGTLEWICEGAQ